MPVLLFRLPHPLASIRSGFQPVWLMAVMRGRIYPRYGSLIRDDWCAELVFWRKIFLRRYEKPPELYSDGFSSFSPLAGGEAEANYKASIYGQKKMSSAPSPTLCVYCSSPDTVKRGWRENKRGKVQLYLCRSCLRTFTPGTAKGKHHPIGIIIDAMSYYNLGFSLEQSCKIITQKYGAEISPSTLANWIEEYKDLCRYHRYRPFALKICKPMETVITATLAHRQLYRFMFHQPKIRLIIREDIKHAHFGPLAEFLSLVPSETPHQYFQEQGGARMSEAPLRFSKEGMIVRSKNNFANKLAAFALQGIQRNKDRHAAVQKFMLANDTVTVATEVPVYIKKDDLAHMQSQLGFEVYKKRGKGIEKIEHADDLPQLITGHIDLIQVRNGQVHILDYKPNAAKEKPIEQLTLYAMALSRLTGLRMYCFKCAWFDEKDYFEFFPLHVVYKRKGKKKSRSDRKQITTKEGVYRLNESAVSMDRMRPTQVLER